LTDPPPPTKTLGIGLCPSTKQCAEHSQVGDEVEHGDDVAPLLPHSQPQFWLVWPFEGAVAVGGARSLGWWYGV